MCLRHPSADKGTDPGNEWWVLGATDIAESMAKQRGSSRRVFSLKSMLHRQKTVWRQGMPFFSCHPWEHLLPRTRDLPAFMPERMPILGQKDPDKWANPARDIFFPDGFVPASWL